MQIRFTRMMPKLSLYSRFRKFNQINSNKDRIIRLNP
jgi:hypothetical protein